MSRCLVGGVFEAAEKWVISKCAKWRSINLWKTFNFAGSHKVLCRDQTHDNLRYTSRWSKTACFRMCCICVFSCVRCSSIEGFRLDVILTVRSRFCDSERRCMFKLNGAKVSFRDGEQSYNAYSFNTGWVNVSFVKRCALINVPYFFFATTVERILQKRTNLCIQLQWTPTIMLYEMFPVHVWTILN